MKKDKKTWYIEDLKTNYIHGCFSSKMQALRAIDLWLSEKDPEIKKQLAPCKNNTDCEMIRYKSTTLFVQWAPVNSGASLITI